MVVLCLVPAVGFFVGGVDALAFAIIVVLLITATLGIGMLTVVNSLTYSGWIARLTSAGWVAFFLGVCGLYLAVGLQFVVAGRLSGPTAESIRLPMAAAGATGMVGLALVSASRSLDAWRLGDRKRAVGMLLLIIAMAAVLVLRRR